MSFIELSIRPINNACARIDTQNREPRVQMQTAKQWLKLQALPNQRNLGMEKQQVSRSFRHLSSSSTYCA